jgi:hypothetical protein
MGVESGTVKHKMIVIYITGVPPLNRPWHIKVKKKIPVY